MANSNPYFLPNEGIPVYQDPVFGNPMSMVSQNPMQSAPASAASKNRRPLQAATNNLMLNAPSRDPNAAMSPQKPATTSGPAPLAPLKPSTSNKLQPMPMGPPPSQGNTTDSLQKKPFLSKFRTAAQKPTMHNTSQLGKENVKPNYSPMPGQSTMNFSHTFSQAQQPQKTAGKRTLMEAPDIIDSRPAKKTKTDEEPQNVEIPPHDSFPPVIDDGTKPNLSYAALIGMALLRSPNRRLTLSQIYKWITTNFSFYKPDDAGWQNSIRHNLSLHKAFLKIERAKDDPGKGCYWSIAPGMEHQFLKEKPTRRFSSSAAGSETVMQARPRTANKDKGKNKAHSGQAKPQSQASQVRPRPETTAEPTLPPPQPTSEALTSHSLPPLPTSQAITTGPDLSSDATIPISDAPAADDNEKNLSNDAPFSPLPPTMHSSPPVPRTVDRAGGTSPPPLVRNPTPSAFRTHSRGLASMDDSGYISSLESSVMRQKPTNLLTSEADRPRLKRGRAEEEIARLRSSPRSPSKRPSRNAYAPPSSSPLRQVSGQNPPLTPAPRLKPPTKAPASVSPNTSLKMHRDQIRSMLESPLRGLSQISEAPYSPAFNLEDTTSTFEDNNEWTDFQDPGDDFLASFVHLDDSSPTKRSAKRPRMDRSHSTSALPDTAGSSFTNKLTNNQPTLKVWEDESAGPADTPSRATHSSIQLEVLQSPVPLAQNASTLMDNLASSQTDWPALDNNFYFEQPGFAAEDLTGLDILQGFEKIGSGSQPSGTENSTGASKPNLSRHYSTTF
ncbi:hypothetical protein VUR80DRAFT_4677 [Thermomyces stellatus]